MFNNIGIYATTDKETKLSIFTNLIVYVESL